MEIWKYRLVAVRINKSNHVEVAKHENSRKTNKEVAFHWWVPFVIKKREVTMFRSTSRFRKTTHKDSVEVSSSLKHASEIDSRNKTIF